MIGTIYIKTYNKEIYKTKNKQTKTNKQKQKLHTTLYQQKTLFVILSVLKVVLQNSLH